MTLSAHDVAAVLRERLPGLGVLKLHKLLYYCQGHHLAFVGKPLFAEQLVAFDNGPVVSALWRQEKRGEPAPPRQQLDEAALNTIGYVLHRYGGLSGSELIRITHEQAPWQLAGRNRPAGSAAVIRRDWLSGFFLTADERDADDEDLDDVPDAAELRGWLASVEAPAPDLRADSVDELRQRMAARG